MACIKLKQLEQFLQTVDDFSEPKVRLEQYTTPSHIASQALYAIQTRHGDLDGRTVLDLGCGPGMLSIGAALLGADLVVGVEIDPDAIEVWDNQASFYTALCACVTSNDHAMVISLGRCSGATATSSSWKTCSVCRRTCYGCRRSLPTGSGHSIRCC